MSLPYRTNSKGLLTRLSPWDDREQIFVPPPLRAKVLALAHYPAVAGHPGSTRMYQTLRREFYWPNMASDTHECVRNCTRCAKERISLRSHSQFLKLFPAARPLEFVALDILGPVTKNGQGNRFLLVISDRCSKLTKSVPLTSISAYRVASAFCEHWVFVYGPPSYLLSDNGAQFTAKFFHHVCNILGIGNLYTTTYHPQTNGKVERFNRTILAALRKYVREERKTWDLFSHAVMYAYNTQPHASTGYPPFELVLSLRSCSLLAIQ